VTVPVCAPTIISGHPPSIISVGSIRVWIIPIIGVTIIPVIVIAGVVAAAIIPRIVPTETKAQPPASPVPTTMIVAPTPSVITAVITMAAAVVTMPTAITPVVRMGAGRVSAVITTGVTPATPYISPRERTAA
jgi:hypothetical protein